MIPISEVLRIQACRALCQFETMLMRDLIGAVSRNEFFERNRAKPR